LKNGLLIKPSVAKHKGSAFGNGIYFADAVAKSAGYCENMMFICRVALGNQKEVRVVDGNLHNNIGLLF